MPSGFSVPGLDESDAAQVRSILQERLNALIDLGLTLKHIHWNVVGPTFIGVHEMLDPQYLAVQAMVDTVAERIATMGGSPIGTPGNIVAERTWDDYSVGRATTMQHLAALDLVYGGVNEDHRKAIEATEDEPVTQDMLIGQSAQLEQFQWFVRAHLEDTDGNLVTEGAGTEGEAAAKVTGARGRASANGADGSKPGSAKKSAARKAAAKR